MPGKISTHVLDAANGKPAQGITIEIFRIVDGNSILLGSAITNVDGRTDAPLFSGVGLLPGTYEMVFHIGGYFSDVASFFDHVPVRFLILDEELNYHIPLICTPWSYSTYRGS